MSRIKGTLVATGIAAVSLGLMPWTASAAEQAVEADVDGNGRADPVTLRQISEDTMLLRVGLPGQFVDTTVTGNMRGQQAKPVDVNGDGKDEVLIPASVGANTTTFTVWGLNDGLHQVKHENGAPLRLPDGGGATAVSTFGCGLSNQELVTVNAVDNGDGFEGNRVTYRVEDGVAHVQRDVAVDSANRDDPRLRAEPASCTPLP